MRPAAMTIESKVIDVIEGRNKSLLLKGLLFLLSLGFQLVVACRNLVYKLGVFPPYKASVPIISIGNIVAGGTGKTPFTQMLVSEVSKEASPVAIVSRGYRSKGEKIGAFVSKGEGPMVEVGVSGDEACWLASHTKAMIWIGKDRVHSVKQAEKKGASLIFLEDGFQQKRLYKNDEIVLLHAKDLFGKNRFLPSGYLRQSPKALKKASLIVVTYLTQSQCKKSLEARIRKYSRAPIVGMSASYSLPPHLERKKVGAFCAIAKPSTFFYELGRRTSIVRSFTLDDHMGICMESLRQFCLECKELGAEALVCTEKDFVKLECLQTLPLEVETLKMEFQCIWNENIWKEIVDSLQTKAIKC